MEILCNRPFAFRLYSVCSLSVNTLGRFIIFVSFHHYVFSLANSELNALMTSWWEKASLPFLIRAKFSFTNRAKRLGVRVCGVPSFFNWGTSSKWLEKRERNENSKRSDAKRQKKRLSRGLRKCIRIREGPLYTCFTNIFSRFLCFERLPYPIEMEDLYVSKSFFKGKSVIWLRRPWFHWVFHLG